MTFGRVVVATDFSDGAMGAARAVRVLAAADARVVVAHVVPTAAPPPFTRPVLSGELGRSEGERRAAEFAAATGLPHVTPRVRLGSVAAEIGRLAADESADLVAVGSHGAGLAILGSRARAIVRRSPVTTLVARGSLAAGRPPVHVAVATDFYAPADAAGAVARGIAEAHRAGLTAVHAVDTGVLGAAIGVAEPSGAAEARGREVLEGTLSDLLDRYAERVLGGGAKRILRFGRPDHVAPRVAEEERVDLLVVGTHGPAGIERALLGSVAESIAERAPCSVLVVKDPEHAARGTPAVFERS